MPVVEQARPPRSDKADLDGSDRCLVVECGSDELAAALRRTKTWTSRRKGTHAEHKTVSLTGAGNALSLTAACRDRGVWAVVSARVGPHPPPDADFAGRFPAVDHSELGQIVKAAGKRRRLLLAVRDETLRVSCETSGPLGEIPLARSYLRLPEIDAMLNCPTETSDVSADRLRAAGDAARLAGMGDHHGKGTGQTLFDTLDGSGTVCYRMHQVALTETALNAHVPGAVRTQTDAPAFAKLCASIPRSVKTARAGFRHCERPAIGWLAVETPETQWRISTPADNGYWDAADEGIWPRIAKQHGAWEADKAALTSAVAVAEEKNGMLRITMSETGDVSVAACTSEKRGGRRRLLTVPPLMHVEDAWDGPDWSADFRTVPLGLLLGQIPGEKVSVSVSEHASIGLSAAGSPPACRAWLMPVSPTAKR